MCKANRKEVKRKEGKKKTRLVVTPVLHSICIVFDPVDEFKEYVRAYYLGDKESKRQQRETKGGRCC